MTVVALSTFPGPVVATLSATRQTAVGTVAMGEVVAGAAVLSAEPGEFTLAGLAASFGYTRAARFFVVTGFPAPVVIAEVGVDSIISGVSVNGGEAGGQLSLRADTGQFALAGVAAEIANSGKFEGETGAYVFTGLPAAPRRGFRIAAATGEFVYIHTSVLKIVYAFPAGFSLLGQAADVVYSPSTTTLVAAGGLFSLLGGSAEFTWNVGFSLDVGEFAVTGQDVAFEIGNRSITAETGLFVLAGQPVGNRLRVETARIILTGNLASLNLNADTFWQRIEDTPEIWTRVSV